MGKFSYIFLAFMLLSVTFATPNLDNSESKEVDTEKSDKKIEKRAVILQDVTWDSWLMENPLQIGLYSVGGILLLGGIGSGIYCAYSKYFKDNGNSSDMVYNTGYIYNPYAPQTYPQGYQYSAATNVAGRSIDGNTNGQWNFARVLELIDIAQKTYQGFDWQSLECQKKVLCELAQRNNEFGEIGRQLSTTFSYVSSVSKRYLNVLEGLPMPKVIQHYLKEFKEAINQGRSLGTDCGLIYNTCKFSLNNLFRKSSRKSTSIPSS